MTPKISIIIPVYNTEPFLEQCLTSAINQTLQEIEIIVINDASTDNSLEVISKFKERDNRIVLINFVENVGNGVGRNEAIRNAKGEYIMFLDSDDWLEENAALLAYKKAIEKYSDVVLLAYNAYSETTKTFSKGIVSTLDPSDPNLFKYLLTNQKGLNLMPWLYLCSREFLLQNAICFSEGIYFEDCIFTFKLIFHSKSLSVLKQDIIYNYRIRDYSITNSKSKKKTMDLFQSHVFLKQFLEEKGIFSQYENEFICRLLVYGVTIIFWDYYTMQKTKKDEELRLFIKNLRESKLLDIKNILLIKKYINSLELDSAIPFKSYYFAYNFLYAMKKKYFLFRLKLIFNQLNIFNGPIITLFSPPRKKLFHQLRGLMHHNPTNNNRFRM